MKRNDCLAEAVHCKSLKPNTYMIELSHSEGKVFPQVIKLCRDTSSASFSAVAIQESGSQEEHLHSEMWPLVIINER